MQNRSDEQLIADYLKGDKTSLEILIRQYLKPIYSFVYSYVGNGPDAEDITQEVFVRMWRNIKKFDPRRNYHAILWGKPQNSFKTWIFIIAKNASIDFLKKKKVLPFSAFSTRGGEDDSYNFLDTIADTSPLPNELLERADAADLLASAVEKLSPKYRLVLFLYYKDQFNFREIAEFLDESIDTIKSRHRRALVALKKLLVESA